MPMCFKCRLTAAAESGMCEPCRLQGWEPSPTEIAAACAAMQDGWDEREEYRHRTFKPDTTPNYQPIHIDIDEID